MKNLIKCLLLGFVGLGFVGCLDDSTTMSKQMDKQWDEYAKSLKVIDTTNEKEAFVQKMQMLNSKIAFYACVPFDRTEQDFKFYQSASFKKCSKNALYPIYDIENICDKSSKSTDDIYLDKNYQKCAIKEREKFFSTIKKLARYKYDSEFDKKQIKESDLEIFANAMEDEVSSKMSVLDSKLGKADKEQVKLVSKKLTAKATQGALQDYAMDTKNKAFNEWLEVHSRKLQNATKKSAENCIEAKCGVEVPPELLGLMISAALPYAFVGAFASGKEEAEMRKQAESAMLGVLLNHPWGKCMIKNETQCQLKSIDEYKIEVSKAK